MSPETAQQRRIYGPTSRYIGGRPNRSRYIPAGRYKNVKGTAVRNILIAENMNIQHRTWSEKKFREVK